jgi:hypothetical protein
VEQAIAQTSAGTDSARPIQQAFGVSDYRLDQQVGRARRDGYHHRSRSWLGVPTTVQSLSGPRSTRSWRASHRGRAD